MHQTTKNKLALLLGVGLLVIAGGATVYFKNVADAMHVAPADAISLPLIQVDTYAVRPLSRALRFRARGALEGIQEVRVSAEVEGKVVERLITEGQRVQPGDVLCRIDATFHELAVQAAQATLSESEATYANAQAEYKRVMELESEHTTAIEHNRYATARDRARAARDLAAAQLQQAQERLKRCTIVAPIHGKVAAVYVEAGELLAPMAPVAEITNLEQMKLVVDLPDFEASQLNSQARVTVTTDSVPGVAFSGTIRAIFPKANPLTRRIPIEIWVENSGGQLRSGTFVDCLLESAARAPQRLIPAHAVIHEFGVDYCYVADLQDHDTLVRRRLIQTRPVAGSVTLLEVVDGLTDGDALILNRQQELSVDQAVATRALPALPAY